jgi:hypothetical protein
MYDRAELGVTTRLRVGKKPRGNDIKKGRIPSECCLEGEAKPCEGAMD